MASHDNIMDIKYATDFMNVGIKLLNSETKETKKWPYRRSH
jgi:hypothetical protein